MPVSPLLQKVGSSCSLNVLLSGVERDVSGLFEERDSEAHRANLMLTDLLGAGAKFNKSRSPCQVSCRLPSAYICISQRYCSKLRYSAASTSKVSKQCSSARNMISNKQQHLVIVVVIVVASAPSS